MHELDEMECYEMRAETLRRVQEELDGLGMVAVRRPSGAADGKLSLAQMALSAFDEADRREALYPELVKGDVMTADCAERAIAAMHAIGKTLLILADHEGAVRAAIQTAIKARRLEAEAAVLGDEPALKAVLDVFPGAAIASIDVLDDDGIIGRSH